MEKVHSFSIFTGHFTYFYDILTYRLTFPILSLSEHGTETKKATTDSLLFFLNSKTYAQGIVNFRNHFLVINMTDFLF